MQRSSNSHGTEARSKCLLHGPACPMFRVLAAILIACLFVKAIADLRRPDEDPRSLIGLVLAIAFGVLLVSVV